MILENITGRWSPVDFSDTPVEEYKMMSILESAKYAPSSMNEQPWIFILVTREDEVEFKNVIEALAEGNQIWAKRAYALVISLARMKHIYKERPNKYAFFDTGMAVSNMLAQATSMGVHIHQMGGYSPDKIKQLFNIPEDIEPVTVMALGYRGNGTGLPVELLERDSKRRPRKGLSEYAFRNGLSKPAF